MDRSQKHSYRRSRKRSARRSAKRSAKRPAKRSARRPAKRSARRSRKRSARRPAKRSARRYRKRSARRSRKRSARRSRGGVKKTSYKELTRAQNKAVDQLSQLPPSREHLARILHMSQPNRRTLIPIRQEARADYDTQETRILWLLGKSPVWYISDQISYILYDMNEYRKTIPEQTTKMEYMRQLRDLIGIVHLTYPRLKLRLPDDIIDEW
jgi:hypothetical protein